MTRFLGKYCSTELVNPERQKEVDFAKALIIFSLAFVHITIESCTDEQLISGMPFVFDSIIGGPFGASVFMLSMGFGMVYGRNKTPKAFIKRGMTIAIGGFVLNVFRFLIPFLIGFKITGDVGQYIEPLWYRFFGNDILQFAPLAFFLMALLLKLKVKPGGMFLIALLMNIAGQFFNGIDFNSPVLNVALGYIVGTEDAAGMVFSDFPLLNWFIVPTAGYIFGYLDIRMTKENELKWYKLTAPIAVIFTVVYIFVGIKLELGMFGEGQNCYYHVSTPDVICCIVSSYSLICICYFVGKIIPKWFERLQYIISSNITEIYCIHWVLISFIVRLWIYCVKGTQIIPYKYVMLLAFAIMVVSIIIAYCWSLFRKILKQRRNNEKA